MKKHIKYLIAIVMILVSQNALADDFDKYAQAVRDSVWAWQMPQFKDYTVDAKYKNESAVILAEHDDVTATGKQRIRFDGGGILGFNLNKELSYTIINRRMILINDKNALEKHSELEFKGQEKSFGRRVSTEKKTVVGARIIKPSGEIIEVDMSESVSVTEGKKNDEDYKKLAIPNLEIGDILDSFSQIEGRIDYQNIPPFVFFFANKYPIKHYSIHCELGDKLTTEYRSVNGAPDFKTARNDRNDVILDVERKDLPKVKGTHWTSPLRELPAIRLSVLFNGNKNIFKPGNARKNGLYKDVPPEDIYRDAMGAYVSNTYYIYGYNTVKKQVKDFLKAKKKEKIEVSNEELAEYINDALLYWVYDLYQIKYTTHMGTLQKLFKDFKIEHKVGFVTDRFEAPRETVAYYDDLYPVMIANDNKQIFSLPSTYLAMRSYGHGYEGETIMAVVPKKMDSQSKDGIKGEVSYIKHPISSYSDNNNSTTTKVQIDGNDPLILDFSRNVKTKGLLRTRARYILELMADWDAAVAKELGVKSDLDNLGKKQKDIDEYNAQKEKAIESQKERMEEEVEAYHNAKAKEVIDYSFASLGTGKNQPTIDYTINYKMEGLVKKAGNNYIIDAGKLIGTQLDLDNDDREERGMNIYMPYARSYNDVVEFIIPEGYTVEGIEKLNQSFDNACAQFTAQVSLDGNTLSIKTSKIYKTLYEPASNWGKLVEVIDGAQTFYNQSIVLKKK